MVISSDELRKLNKVPEQIYVFELPVRIWHWTHAFSIFTLMITGYLIAVPLPSLHGEASLHFIMGNLRMIHFIAGMVFSVGLLVRFYWAVVGNVYSRQLLFPRILHKVFWQEFWHEVKWYAFLTRKCGKFAAHNPLAQIAIFFFNVVLALFMLITGFALYSQGTGAGSWADTLFGWVFVIVPSSQTVKMWHLFGMWAMLFFVIIHIYMSIREDVHSRQNGVGTMISGWRRFRDDGPMSPQ